MTFDWENNSIGDLITEGTRLLNHYNIYSPRQDLEILLCEICKMERSHLLTQRERKLSTEESHQIYTAIKRRIHGESVAYILGYKYFYKYKFLVDARVLVPRPETELIVEQVLQWASQNKDHTYQILDMGTGSGCIGLSLCQELKNSQLTAVDISTEALDVFKKNTKNLSLSHRVRAVHGDVPLPLPLSHKKQVNSWSQDPYDIIVANPPYIDPEDQNICPNVIQHEPPIALFSERGISSPLKWMEQAASLLKASKSIFMMEFGLGQGDNLKQEAQSRGYFNNVQLLQDYTHRDRFFIASN